MALFDGPRSTSTRRSSARETGRRVPAALRFTDVHGFVSRLLGDDVHANRVLSLSNGVVGVLHSAALGIHAIGRGLADALGLNAKHTVKQVDRLLSNRGITIWDGFAQWVRFVVADRKELLVALDWTEFDGDSQTTLALYATTSHGRATPLVWKTVEKGTLKNRRNEYELLVVERLHTLLPPDVDVMLLADCPTAASETRSSSRISERSGGPTPSASSKTSPSRTRDRASLPPSGGRRADTRRGCRTS